MPKSPQSQIAQFLKNRPRQKLVILSQQRLEDLSFTNIGQELSMALEKTINHKQISMVTYDHLERILQDNEHLHPVYGPYVAITNLGILFESTLKIHAERFLEAHSTNQTLFVVWNGEIDGVKLYFLTKNKGVPVNLTNISHIIL